MTVLRTYAVQEIEDLGGALIGEIDSGVISEGLLEHYMGIFKFRDGEGLYWSYSPRSGQWSLASGDDGLRDAGPAGRLEGPEALTELWPQSASPNIRAEPMLDETEPVDQEPVQGFEARMAGIRRAYQAGEINSAAAEQLSGQVFLIDKEMNFWTVGFRSGYWYRRADGKWVFSRQKPSTDSLLDIAAEENNEAVEEAFLEFVMNEGDPLPEPVADEWSPPEGLVQDVFICPVCAKADLGRVEQCRFCGTNFADQGAREAPVRPKFCGHCGAPVSGSERFCTQCGEAL